MKRVLLGSMEDMIGMDMVSIVETACVEGLLCAALPSRLRNAQGQLFTWKYPKA